MTTERMATWFLKCIALTLIAFGMWSIVFVMTEVDAGVGIKLLFSAVFFGVGVMGWHTLDDFPPQSKPLPPVAPKPVYIPPKIPMATVIQFGQRQCVYLLYTTTGLYRIGLSNQVYNRLCTHITTLPCQCWFVALIPTNDMRRLESALHKQFAHKCVHHEWFALDTADVAFIQSLAQED